MIRNRAMAASVIITIFAALPGFGQSVPGTAPTASVDGGRAVQPKPSGDAVILPSLKGLVFISQSADFVKSGVVTAGIDTSRVEMLNRRDFREELASYLGKPLTYSSLHKITATAMRYYVAHSHPLVDITVPEQDVQSGAIQVLVTEFRVGSVRARGNKWFSDSIVMSALTEQHGDFIDSQQIENELDAANGNPFRKVDLVYVPSSQPGYTDLVLQTQDRLPLQVSSGFDNNGVPATGRSRWNMGIDWGNAFGLDQQISYQFSSSDNFFTRASSDGASFISNSLNWSMRVRQRDSLSIFGNYEQSRPDVGPDFGLLGKSGQASIRYSLALPRTRTFVQSLAFGYDFKTTNNNLDFGGVNVSTSATEIDQFPISYAANLSDHRGATGVTTTLTSSPGGMTPNNATAAFQPAQGQSGQLFASARYMYWRTDVTRLNALPESLVWSCRLIGQVSSGNLLYTEQLAAGGSEILRGYDPNSILGDQGIILSNELRSPPLRKAGEFSIGQLQALAFWDYAHVAAHTPVDGAINKLNASSVGLGFRYNLRSNITARFDYGWQLQHLPDSDSRDHLANVALVIAY